MNVWTSWYNRVRTLEKLDFVRNGHLTEKGRFGTKIFTEELVTTELFHDDKWRDWSVVDIACIAAAITYEVRHSRRGKRPEKGKRFFRLMGSIGNNDFLMRNLNLNGLALRIPIIEKWAHGWTFKDLVEEYEMAEGDLIRIFRQTIDVMEQVKRATSHGEFKDKLSLACTMLDKEVVSVKFE